MAARYTPHDEERLFPEQHSSGRSNFARDRARLVHSSALRRLGAKTQVLSPTMGIDFARTRLTHSLEVAQVGRELAARLGVDPDIVDTACLAHDLGHPPFGHNGERALEEWAADIGGFEGNAQTLRILVRLEPKVVDDSGVSYGLNLTRASLDASCKYPWSRNDAKPSGGDGRTKFGFYKDDAEVFRWVRDAAPVLTTCIEAEIMDLSDDIAYSVHDFEDAIVSGFIDPVLLNARSGHGELLGVVCDWADGEFDVDELDRAFDRIAGLEVWPMRWEGDRSCQAKLKNFTSHMIGHFSGGATLATREAYPIDVLTRFTAQLVVPRQIRAEIAVLKGLVAAFVVSHQTQQPVYARQREVLVTLASELLDHEDAFLEPAFREDWNAAHDDAERKRVIVDQVASLTDQSALGLLERHAGHMPVIV